MCAFQGLEIVTDAASRAPATAAASALTDRLRALGVACHATGDYSNVLKCKPPLTITLRAAEHYARALGTRGQMRGNNSTNAIECADHDACSHSHQYTFLGRESNMLFVCLEKCDTICLNFYFEFLCFSPSDIGLRGRAERAVRRRRDGDRAADRDASQAVDPAAR